MADIAGISVNTLYKMERGQANPAIEVLGKILGRSFEEFGKRIGVNEKRVTEILTQFATQYPLTEQLVEASFLQPDTKKTDLAGYRQRRNRFTDMK